MNLKVKNAQSGFTLIELLIAASIFLVVMAAIFSLLRIGNIARDSINNSSETLNNARVSINAAGRDALNAGFGYSRNGSIVPDDLANLLLNIPMDTGTDRDLFTAVMAGNNVTTSVLTVNNVKNDVVAFMTRDLQFNGGNPVVVNGATFTNTWVDLSTAAGACASCRMYDLYVVESGTGNHALAMATNILNTNSTIRIQSGDPLGLNRNTNLTPLNLRSILRPCAVGETADCFNYLPQATVKRVFLTSYSVNSDGTLVRKTYGNNTGGTAAQQIQEVPLAYGVQSFQVKYLLSNGTFTDDPSNGNNNQGNLNQVVQVEFSITIKPRQNRGQVTSTQLIQLNSTFSTRNIKYDAE